MKTLSVTIISGFPGSGKTSVLQHLQKSLPEMAVAVIANSGSFEELLRDVAELTESGRFDYLLLESSGASGPMELAEMFSSTDESGDSPVSMARIDTMVTVVDAEHFLSDFQSVEELRDRGIGRDHDDDRDVVGVLIDQIEFANVILLNKTDRISNEESGQLLAVLKKLNPDAHIFGIEHGQAPVQEVVNTGRFQMEWSPGADAWQKMLAGDESSEVDAYGISRFVYRARRPFHPQRFWDFWMDGEHAPSILRSKGYFWLATKNAMSGYWSHTGQVLAAEPGGTWWAETPRAEWPADDPELLDELNSVWDEVWGDRRQELMIIGQDMDTAATKDALNACLLTDTEMQAGPQEWRNLEDPFGPWNEGHDCDSSHDHG
jgi:G3E family GTPase